MKEFLKKYWTHILSILLLIVTNVALIFQDTKNKTIISVLSVILAILVVCTWIEIFYYFFFVTKNKEGKINVIHAIMCFTFNIFYIPCYNLKHIFSDKKYKLKNSIYLVISILLFSTFIFLEIKDNYLNSNENNNSIIGTNIEYLNYKTYTSKDNVVNINVPEEYEETQIGEYDLYFVDNNTEIGVFLYDGYECDDNKCTDDDILTFQKENISEEQEKMLLLDSDIDTKNNKIIKKRVYSVTIDGKKLVYNLATIIFSDKKDYIIYIVEISTEEDYIEYKNTFDEILKSVNLNGVFAV